MIFKTARLTQASPIAAIPAPLRGFVVGLAFSRNTGATGDVTVELRRSNFVSGGAEDELIKRTGSLAAGGLVGDHLFNIAGLATGGPGFAPNQGIPFALSDTDQNIYIRVSSATTPWTVDVRVILAPVIYP